jgi:hypothetical protein
MGRRTHALALCQEADSVAIRKAAQVANEESCRILCSTEGAGDDRRLSLALG